MNKLASVASVLGASVLVLLAACSDDAKPSSTPADAGGSSSSSGSTSSSSGDAGRSSSSSSSSSSSGDAGNAGVNGCTTFVDHTADAVVSLEWGFGITSAPDHCSKIKVGSKVSWTGDFTVHPLEASGGDATNPITSNGVSGTTAEITFPAAGTFGYVCGVHASMTGAIQVVP